MLKRVIRSLNNECAVTDPISIPAMTLVFSFWGAGFYAFDKGIAFLSKSRSETILFRMLIYIGAFVVIFLFLNAIIIVLWLLANVFLKIKGDECAFESNPFSDLAGLYTKPFQSSDSFRTLSRRKKEIEDPLRSGEKVSIIDAVKKAVSEEPGTITYIQSENRIWRIVPEGVDTSQISLNYSRDFEKIGLTPEEAEEDILRTAESDLCTVAKGTV